MRFLYSLGMYFLTPYLLLRLWWKGRRLPAYKQRIMERFFLSRKNHPAIDVWLHAVSLGEVIAATPLIHAILEKKWTILVTTMTPTGSDRVTSCFGEAVVHCYIPYDLPGALKRFFRKIKPKVGIIMETELWPNLINQAYLAGVPLLLANGRLSTRSLNRYLKMRYFFKALLNQFTAILVQSTEDAQCFHAIGAKKEQVKVLGNMKFDVQTEHLDLSLFNTLKKQWGENRVVVMAASTHDDEESQILKQLKKLQQAIPSVLLLIAPRHPERFKMVYQMALQQGFNTGLRSHQDALSPQNEVIVLDCLGELLGFYQVSDYAFVGGSFVPVGGHNVLEPIAVSKPVLSGAEVHNFKAICNELNVKKAIRIVNNADELIEAIVYLHQHTDLKKEMVKNATRVLESNRGAVKKHWQEIELVLNKRL